VKSGDVIDGRWRLEAPAQAPRGLSRWEAVDLADGARVDVLALRPEMAALADHRHAFASVHAALAQTDTAAARQPLAITSVDGRQVVVRAHAERTLDGVTRLPLAEVAVLGARLLPAVHATSAASRGVVLPSDVAFDGDGKVWFAPTGRPLTQVDRAALGIGEADGSAEASLAELLHRLATGRPTPAGGPDTGMELLDEALGLMASGEAPPAVADRLSALAAQPPEQRSEPAPSAPSPDPPSSPVARLDAVDVVPVVIPASALQHLSPAQRSAAAGWAGASSADVDAAMAGGLPLVLAHAPTSRRARELAAELATASGLPVEVDAGPGIGAWMALVTTLSTALLLTGAAVVAGLVWGLLAAALLAIGGVASLGLAIWPATRLLRGRRHATPRDPEGVRALRARIAALRRELARMDLAETVAVDMRGRLRELERSVDQLALAAPDGVLQATDLAMLEAHAATDPSSAKTAAGYRRGRDIRDDELGAIAAALDSVGSTIADASADLVPSRPGRSRVSE
jgi:hypothetical protein